MSLIQAQDLTKIYGKGETAVTALDHVNLSVNAGEFVAVMGPSGCGKSTLLHLIGGLDRATEGTVQIDGSSLDKLSDDKLTELLAATGTAFGLLSGIYLSYVMVEGMTASGIWPMQYSFPFAGILAAIAIGLIFGVIAALIPVRQASQMEIIHALRYE